MAEYVLQVRGISKTFSGTRALNGVHFAIKPGEVVGLVGENGAGKSTLMKIITGVYGADSGTILLEERAVGFKNSLEALRAGIAMMHQELNLFRNISVYENIYLDRKDYRNCFGRIDRNKMKRDARELMQKLGAALDVETKAAYLSIREQQIVEIARAVSSNAKVIIMDEPSAALTEGEVQNMFEVVRTLKNRGVAVIYVSHRMNEIKQICDRVTVLRDGENAGELLMARHEIRDIVTKMVGREIENYYPKQKRIGGRTILEVEGLQSGLLKDISFRVREHEVVCLYGLAGSGITELAECLFGLRRSRQGKVRVNGTALTQITPAKAIRHGVAYVPPDRRSEGIVADQSIENNIILASYKKSSIYSFLQRKKITDIARGAMRKLNIKAVDSKQKIVFLSGGNQQKVVLTKWLETQPSVLILNEPTRGVDVGAKAEIYAQIDHLAAEGMGIVFITSEVPEVIGMADRVLVINKGRIASELQVEECSQEKLLAVASGKNG